MSKKSLRIGFLHPDLGIGGAEQLVINLALSLKSKGHTVKLYTPHHDKNHCFKETIDGSLEVEVHGNLFPRTIFGKCVAMCAWIRMFLAALYIIAFGWKFDLIIVDQVSVVVPLLRLMNRRVLFYCHFPDKLLCVQRKSILKRIYRFFLDLFEELCLLPANDILVNSYFTQSVYSKEFPILKKFKKLPGVLYPSTDFATFDSLEQELIKQQQQQQQQQEQKYFLSLNRYERKKNINLAIQAFALFKQNNPNSTEILIVAGGYEDRIIENAQHKKELEKLAEELNVKEQVSFKINISNLERVQLLKNASALLYTPENEHFGQNMSLFILKKGIVPVEAMYLECPVIACNSGGPVESVHEKAGFRVQQQPIKWAEKMSYISQNPQEAKEMGKFGKEYAKGKFGLEAFGNTLNSVVFEIIEKKKKTVEKDKKLQ